MNEESVGAKPDLSLCSADELVRELKTRCQGIIACGAYNGNIKDGAEGFCLVDGKREVIEAVFVQLMISMTGNRGDK